MLVWLPQGCIFLCSIIKIRIRNLCLPIHYVNVLSSFRVHVVFFCSVDEASIIKLSLTIKVCWSHVDILSGWYDRMTRYQGDYSVDFLCGLASLGCKSKPCAYMYLTICSTYPIRWLVGDHDDEGDMIVLIFCGHSVQIFWFGHR